MLGYILQLDKLKLYYYLILIVIHNMYIYVHTNKICVIFKKIVLYFEQRTFIFY